MSLTTVIFEIINFLILVWLLRKILYQPLQRALRERQQELEEEREGAAAVRQEAEDIRAEAAEERDALKQMHEAMQAEMREEVEQERQALLERARAEAEARREHAQRQIDDDRERLHREAEALAIDQSAALAGELLAQLKPEALHEALVEAVCATLEESPAPPASNGHSSAVRITTARRLDPGTLDRLRRALETGASDPVQLSQTEDAELIAGLVVRAGDRVIDGSARNQLEAFQRLAREHLSRME